MNWRTLLFAWTIAVPPTHAMTWQDMWATRDQQAQAVWKKGDYTQAEQLFQRPDWRATAAYRAGHYQQAAQEYQTLQTADGYYNAGNALAKMSQYQAAVKAYDQALQSDPHHQDALFNRQIVKKLLEKQQQSQPSDSKQPDAKDSKPQEKPQKSSSPAQNTSSPKPTKPDQQNQQKEPTDAKTHPESSQTPPKQDTPISPKQKDPAAQKQPANPSEHEAQQAKEQWLRLIPDDPAYLLREKFLRDHLQREQGEVVP